MNNEQRELLGSYGVAVLPENLSYCFDNLLDKGPYEREKIKIDIGNLSGMGKFWKFIKGGTYAKIDEEKDKFTINQPSLDVTKGCLVFLFFGVDSIDVTFKDGTKKSVKFVTSIFMNVQVAPIDFTYDNPIVNAVVHFYMNMADDLTWEIETILVEKPVVDVKEVMLKKANIKVSTGESLINVYFQEASDDYGFTKVELYIGDQANFNLISKKKVEDGNYYCSFDNLAFGSYGVKVIQFDAKSNVIFESEIIKVHLVRPDYSGKPNIVI
jgi:hypothetical protein